MRHLCALAICILFAGPLAAEQASAPAAECSSCTARHLSLQALQASRTGRATADATPDDQASYPACTAGAEGRVSVATAGLLPPMPMPHGAGGSSR